MKKINIGFFIDSFFPMVDGVIMVVDNYAKRMCKYANVTVFAPHSGEYNYSNLPYRVVLCKSLPVRNLDYNLPLGKLDSNFRKQLKEANLDIVHIHSQFFVGQAGMKYAKEHNIPSIITFHSQFKQNYEEVVKSNKITQLLVENTVKFYEKADECWAVNDKMAELFINEYGGTKKPSVMYNATDLAPCKDTKAIAEEINNLYGISNDEKVLLFVGRIDSLKNIFLIADAINVLKEKSNLSFKMMFVGSGKDEEKLKEKIHSLKIENNVIICGRITDRDMLAKIYSRANLFVFPSLYDANSLVQIEAASQKTPSLFIRNSVTGASITEGVSGYYCENSKESLANKIIEIFDNPNEYEKISDGAFHALYHTWDEMCTQAYNRYFLLINNYSKKKEIS